MAAGLFAGGLTLAAQGPDTMPATGPATTRPGDPATQSADAVLEQLLRNPPSQPVTLTPTTMAGGANPIVKPAGQAVASRSASTQVHNSKASTPLGVQVWRTRVGARSPAHIAVPCRRCCPFETLSGFLRTGPLIWRSSKEGKA